MFKKTSAALFICFLVYAQVTSIPTATGGGVGNVTAGGTLTSGLPVIGQGSQAVAVGTKSGSTTEFATSTGSKATGNCVEWDANDNLVDSGDVCGGGAGANMITELGDFKIVINSTTEVEIGAGCDATTPCNIRMGNSVLQVTASCTVTLAASSVSTNASTAYVYLKNDRTLAVGLNPAFTAANVTTSGCTEETSISDFPTTSVPLGYVLAGTTDNQWDANSNVDFRGFGRDPITCGANMTCSYANGILELESSASGGGTFEIDKWIGMCDSGSNILTQADWAIDTGTPGATGCGSGSLNAGFRWAFRIFDNNEDDGVATTIVLENWDGSSDITVKVHFMGNTTDNLNVVFRAAVQCVAVNDNLDAAASYDADTVSTTVAEGTAAFLRRSATITLTAAGALSGCATTEWMRLQIIRDGDAAGDTSTNGIYFLGATVTWPLS